MTIIQALDLQLVNNSLQMCFDRTGKMDYFMWNMSKSSGMKAVFAKSLWIFLLRGGEKREFY